MADLEISYKGNKIVELSETGTKTLKTAGKYCEDDIEVSYTKSGGDNPYKYASTIQSPFTTFADVPILQYVIDIDAPYATAFGGSFWNDLKPRNYTTSGVTVTVNITAPKLYISAHCFRSLNSGQVFYYFNIPGGIKIRGSGFGAYFLYNCSRVKEFNCEIDLTGQSTIDTGCLTNLTNLQTIFFKPNSAAVIYSFSSAPALKDEAIISIANGLNESTTGQTLTLHSTPKARCSSIMGTVALDETETYHIFTADENGMVTLTDFITNTKGWSLA